jgi:hypothetical protein
MDDSRLDLDHIRRIASLRRSQSRSDQWRLAWIAFVVLVLIAAARWLGVSPWLIGSCLVGLGGWGVRRHVRRRPIALASSQDSSMPDFSTLGDGSHRVRDLENIRDE